MHHLRGILMEWLTKNEKGYIKCKYVLESTNALFVVQKIIKRIADLNV